MIVKPTGLTDVRSIPLFERLYLTVSGKNPNTVFFALSQQPVDIKRFLLQMEKAVSFSRKQRRVFARKSRAGCFFRVFYSSTGRILRGKFY